MLYRCKTFDWKKKKLLKGRLKKTTRKSFLTVGWLLDLASYPANKTDELFQQKTLLRMLLFRVQTKQTPVHNNEPANDRKIYIQHDMNVDQVAICLRVMSFKKSPWEKKIQ